MQKNKMKKIQMNEEKDIHSVKKAFGKGEFTNLMIDLIKSYYKKEKSGISNNTCLQEDDIYDAYITLQKILS